MYYLIFNDYQKNQYSADVVWSKELFTPEIIIGYYTVVYSQLYNNL